VTTMDDMQPTGDLPNHRDRSVGLVVFGAIEILVGLALEAFIPLSLLAMMFGGASDLSVALSSVAFFGILGLLFIALGVGAIRGRLWARELSLSLGWLWLITGVCTLVLTWLLAPGMWSGLAASTGLSGSAVVAVVVVVQLLLTILYVVLPAALVLFFRSPDVAATCRYRDPRSDWAGRCPQPLLALVVAYALGGLSVFAMPAYGFIFPCFGRIVSGPVGVMAWGLVTALAGILAWGTWHRARWAWWLAVAATVAATISTVATFATTDASTVLMAMALPIEQRRLLESIWPTSPWVHAVGWIVVWGSLLGYLIAVRRWFDGPHEPDGDRRR
jgi:hypothetical protein